MNEQLIKFIELCLVDGVISDKEREVIFRKSKELGVDDDECEIILQGMTQQREGLIKVNDSQNVLQKPITKKKVLELKFNDLNQNKIIEIDIDDLSLELNKKEKSLNETKIEIQNFIKSLKKTNKPNKIKNHYDFIWNVVTEHIEGGKMFDSLLTLLNIDKSYFNNTTPGIEDILLVVRIRVIYNYFLIFKQENNKVMRFMVRERMSYDFLDDESKNYIRENDPYELLSSNINLIDKDFLKFILRDKIKTIDVIDLNELKEEMLVAKKYEEKMGRKLNGKIINEDLLNKELHLLDYLSNESSL